MIRKIFNLVPRSFKEKVKLFYYNRRNKDFSFYIEEGLYKTVAPVGWSIFSSSPLYFIVKDIGRYERFYTVDQGDVVIDAGANEGIFSLVYSKKVRDSGKVFAFEPDKMNLSTFENNLSLNRDVGNIFLQKQGLWSYRGHKIFHEAGSVGSSMFYQSINSTTRQIEVTSLDEFAKSLKISKLDFIKMDIEGAEIEALEGSIETINLYRPNFAIASYHIIDNEPTFKKLESFFEKINYPFKTIFYEDGEILTYAGPQIEGGNS